MGEAFVRKTRERLELPADKYPSIRFYDIEDFEVQNIEEMTNNMHLFVDLSGESMPAAHSAQAPQQPQQAQIPQQAHPGAADQQFGAVNTGADRGALLVSLPVQVLDNGKLRVEQVELYEKDDAEDVARVFCINHRIGDPECAKLLEALKQRRAAAVGV